MSGNDDPNARRQRIYIELSKVVDCINPYLAHLHHLGLSELLRPGSSVIIPAYRGDRRYRAEFIQSSWVADVARVDDQVAALQKRFRLGS